MNKGRDFTVNVWLREDNNGNTVKDYYYQDTLEVEHTEVFLTKEQKERIKHNYNESNTETN